METKIQLPDFETFTLTEEEGRELKRILEEKEYRLDLLEFHKENMIYLSNPWVQEKLKERDREDRARNFVEFKI